MFDFLFTPQGNSVHTNLITDQKPFFIYNQKKIEENISAVKQFTESLFSKPVSLSFSLKTQPNYKILKCINAQNLSLDVSSLSELEYALELGFAAHKIFLGGVGITDQAIKKALEIGVSAIHLNSIEIFKVAKAQKQKSSSASALTIRFHPTYLRGNKIGETKEALIAQLKNSGSLDGLHVYVGRESFEEKIVTDIFKEIDELADAGIFKKNWTLFFGPGLPDLDQNPIQGFPIKSGAPNIKIEVGRSIVSSCGIYGAPVLAVKRFVPEKKTIIIDGGFQHFGSPWITLKKGPSTAEGLFLDSLGRKKVNRNVSAAIYGSLCLWHDCLHPNFNVPEDLQRGDWIIVPHMGAYGLTAGAPLFIGETLPQEFFFDGKEILNVTHKNFAQMADKEI